MSNAAGLATAAIFCGKLNTPAPSIELKTSAVKHSGQVSFPLASCYESQNPE
jgi:hypothetical protein